MFVYILAQPVVLILIVFNITEVKKYVSCIFEFVICDTILIGFFKFYVALCIFMWVLGFLFENLFITTQRCESGMGIMGIIWGFFLVPEYMNSSYEMEWSEPRFFSSTESRK